MMDIISNNIANVNTIGYKSSRGNFVDQLSQVYTVGKAPYNAEGRAGSGGVNPLQYGLGVRMGSVSMDMSQGILETTERPLDMALQGEGFFIYNVGGREFYSRAGSVIADREGNLVDSTTGAFVQGYNLQSDGSGRISKDSNGNNILSSRVENLRVDPKTISPPKQTQSINLAGNLSSAMVENDTRSTSINVFDNRGGTHNIEFTFTKTANPNEFGITATVDGTTLPLSATTVTFNADGSINTPLTLDITAADLNTAIGNQAFDETTPRNLTVTLADADNLLSGMTNYASETTASFRDQDGYETGEMISINVDATGKIWGSFTNGQTEALGQVVIAKFTNPGGLRKEGNNYLSTTPNSGLPVVGTPGESFPSTSIYSAALELSNVDLTKEFTNMIMTQRAFEAAARTITVSDQMLAETNMIKR
jgi:flagellar hook protein FlgE